MSFDKEAAVTFAFLGYYPMIKFWFDRYKLGWVGKLAYFNFSIVVMYLLLLQLFGMADLAEEYAELGRLGIWFMLVLGNVTFYLLDIVLTRLSKRK